MTRNLKVAVNENILPWKDHQ